MTRILREDIVLGRRPPGSKLVERDIAAELNVSRLPVREAIRTLCAEGIVIARPRRWAIVREFTLDDIRDFAEVRESIETLLFVYATERHDEAGLEALRAILQREERAAHAGEVAEGRAAAGAFHEYMAVLAGNEMLTELVQVFATRLKWIFAAHNDLAAMAAEHRRLFEAIASRDVERVKQLVSDHLIAGRESAMQRFTEAASPSATSDR